MSIPTRRRAACCRCRSPRPAGNQNFDTFDTLNIFSKRGDGAAGMSATFDTLMSGNGDEPDSLYGLLARAVSVSPDKLGYRFLLRPEARFADGSKVTAADVKFSLDVLKEKAHPTYSQLLVEVDGVDAEADDVALVRFVKERTRDAHLIVAGMPIFSAAWWKGRDFDASTLEAPLGSGAYRVKTFEQGRFIEFELRDDYWAKDLPINVGQNNFRRLRFEYYRERQVAFEAFKAGAINFHQEYTSRVWATGYDFPAFNDGRVKKESLHNGAPTGSQGWYFNTRREQFKDPRVREALGLGFDFEWTNKNVMFSSYKRVVSYFQNSAMEAVGPPGPDELDAPRAVARQGSRFRVRRSLRAAGQRRLGQRPRAAEARQRNAARRRLQARGRRAEAAERRAVHDRVPRFFRRAAAAHGRRSNRTCASSASTRIRASSTRRNTRAAPRTSISTSSPRRSAAA